MGCEELIESLRKEAEEKLGHIRREAEEEASKIRASVSLKLEALQQDEVIKRAIEEEAAKVLTEAEKRARIIRLKSEDDISKSLFSLARSSLASLRENGYGEMFSKCVCELPPFAWQKVKVNPADQALAQEFFPEAAVMVDSAISGGMEVEAKEGRMRIDNTFEKRLEKAWPEMLPELMCDIYQEVTGDGTPPEY